MPLTSLGEAVHEEVDGYFFAMADLMGNRVRCGVTYAALQDAAGVFNPSRADCLAAFERHRAYIERLASSAYDRGHSVPMVHSSDLSGSR